MKWGWGGGGRGGWRLILYFTGGDGTSMKERSEISLPKPPLNTSIGVTTKHFWGGKSTSRKSNAPPPFPKKKSRKASFFFTTPEAEDVVSESAAVEDLVYLFAFSHPVSWEASV